MKVLMLAVALASAITSPAYAASRSPDRHGCECPKLTPEAPIDPVNLSLARVLVETITPKADAKTEFNGSMLRMAQFERLADESLRSTMQTEFTKLMVNIDPIVERHLDKIREVEALAYARTFTPAELKAATTFAAIPEGKTFLTRIYEIHYDPAIMEEQSLLLTDLSPALETFRVTVCKSQAAARLAAGEKKAKCSLS